MADCARLSGVGLSPCSGSAVSCGETSSLRRRLLTRYAASSEGILLPAGGSNREEMLCRGSADCLRVLEGVCFGLIEGSIAVHECRFARTEVLVLLPQVYWYVPGGCFGSRCSNAPHCRMSQ